MIKSLLKLSFQLIYPQPFYHLLYHKRAKLSIRLRKTAFLTRVFRPSRYRISSISSLCTIRDSPDCGRSAGAEKPATGTSFTTYRLRCPKNTTELCCFILVFFDRCPALIVRFIFHRKRSQTHTLLVHDGTYKA